MRRVANNDSPVLLEGEEGYETDTQRRKIGNGVTAWNSLAYTDDELNKYVATAVTNVGIAPAVLSDLTVTLPAGGKYLGVLTVFASCPTAADGLRLDFDGGTATATTFVGAMNVAGPAATVSVGVTAALATDLVVTDLSGTGTNGFVVHFFLEVNAAGTFIPRQAKEADAAGATLTILKGTNLRMVAVN